MNLATESLVSHTKCFRCSIRDWSRKLCVLRCYGLLCRKGWISLKKIKMYISGSLILQGLKGLPYMT